LNVCNIKCFMKIPVGIVDDKSQNCLLLSDRLNYSEEIVVVLTASDGKDFLDKMNAMPLEKHPAVILMDIEMPGMDGIAAVNTGKIRYPHVHFLMLTVFDDDEKIFEAIKAGAAGYLLKDEKISSIIECIVQLNEFGCAPMSPRIARKTMDLLMHANLPRIEKEQSEKYDYSLSAREVEILKLLVDGYGYKQIAGKLFLSSHTVKKHVANIYNKLHVSSKAQAIKIANKDRLI
jgi:DNA-binding NarL/FixJ family response regulator